MAQYAKTVVAVATAILVALSALLGEGGDAGGLTLGDWITVALAGLGALGVYAVPNAPDVSELDDEERGPDDF